MATVGFLTADVQYNRLIIDLVMCIGLTLEVDPSGLCKVEEDGDRLHCDY